MKKSIYGKTLLNVFMFFVIMINLESYAQDTLNALKLKITTDDKAYRIGQPIYVDVQIENNSNVEQCFGTTFIAVFKLVLGDKAYNLQATYLWQEREYAPDIEKYVIPANSSISRITTINLYSDEVNLEEKREPFEIFAQLPIVTSCNEYKYGQLISNSIKVKMQAIAKDERKAWKELSSIEIPKRYEEGTNKLVYYLPYAFWNFKLNNIEIAAIKTFISKFPANYYSDKLKLTLAIDMALKDEFKEAERLFSEIREKDEEYYFLKMRLINSIYASSLSNEDAESEASKILEDLSKSKREGILGEIIAKRVGELREWISKWKTIRKERTSK